MTTFELKEKTEELIALCQGALRSGERIAVTGHDSPDADSIISAFMMQRLLKKFNIEASVRFGTRPDNVTLRDMSALGLVDGICFDGFDKDERLLLVDHHKSFYENGVLASIDHHTTLPEPEGDVAIVMSASSCGRVIFDMAESVGASDGELERLAIYSVYLDTQSCRSPKFKKSDIEWLERGIKRLGIDRRELERMGFCLCDHREDIDVLAMYGFKKYAYGARPSFSTCIQIDTDEEEWSGVTEKIVDHLKGKLAELDGAVWAFVVNMPILARSDIYFIERSGEVSLIELDRLASRSRDVIPVVSIAE